jgi:ATP-binding cassette subfamily B protein
MTLGMLTSVQYILGQLTGPLDRIVNFIISLQLSAISYARVTDIHRLPAENDIVTNSDNLADFTSDLHLKNVSYRYGSESFALKNLTAAIPGGKTTAIVGESGCGKSTLLKILAGLYVPSNGHVLLGSRHLSSISLESWRKRCGVITQESSLFRDTICNNITVGRSFDRNKLLKAVTIADIRNEIEMLPKGYETMIGENGRGVSEGQKQRILLARAIYDEPDYIFLDEMTSSLDVSREDNVLDSLKRQMPDKTIVMVSHRPASIMNADRVVVIKDGFIAGCGTHETLMAGSAEYCRLLKLK